MFWSGQRDSNPRPSAPKADALPDCAMPRLCVGAILALTKSFANCIDSTLYCFYSHAGSRFILDSITRWRMLPLISYLTSIFSSVQ